MDVKKTVLFAQGNGERISISGSEKAVKGVANDICSVTLKAGHIYLLLGNTYTSVDDPNSYTSAEFVRKSGTSTGDFPSKTRTTMRYGGGICIYAYADISTDSTISLQGYGYSDLTYNYKGSILAIQLR